MTGGAVPALPGVRGCDRAHKRKAHHRGVSGSGSLVSNYPMEQYHVERIRTTHARFYSVHSASKSCASRPSVQYSVSSPRPSEDGGLGGELKMGPNSSKYRHFTNARAPVPNLGTMSGRAASGELDRAP